MNLARVGIFVLFACISTLGAAEEKLTPQKRADIERLLAETGALEVSQQMAGMASVHLAQTLKKMRPDIPEEVIEMLPEEVEAVFAANLESFKDAMIPLYHKHFTASEISELIGFYETSLGKKLIQVMPALARDSMEIGQRWGQSLGPQIDARIRARFKKEGVAI